MQSLLKKYSLHNSRTALYLVGKEILRRHVSFTVHVPEYICASVINSFKQDNINIVSYEIDFKNKKSKFNNKVNDNDLVVCVNYYGENFDYSDIKNIKNIYTLYDSAHNAFLNIEEYFDYDFIIVGQSKTIPFVSGGAYLYSRLNIKEKIYANTFCSSLKEMPNFIYDIFLYYLYNRKFKNRKFNIHSILCVPFEETINLFCKKEIQVVYGITILSKTTLYLSKILNKYYLSQYKKITRYFYGQDDIRTFLVIREHGFKDVKKLFQDENIMFLNNWIDQNNSHNSVSKATQDYFKNTIVVKVSPFMNYKLLKEIILNNNLEVL